MGKNECGSEYKSHKVLKVGKNLTLQDLIDYANEHGFEPSEMPIKIENIDTGRIVQAYHDIDEIWEPMIVLY